MRFWGFPPGAGLSAQRHLPLAVDFPRVVFARAGACVGLGRGAGASGMAGAGHFRLCPRRRFRGRASAVRPVLL